MNGTRSFFISMSQNRFLLFKKDVGCCVANTAGEEEEKKGKRRVEGAWGCEGEVVGQTEGKEVTEGLLVSCSSSSSSFPHRQRGQQRRERRPWQQERGQP